MTHPDISAFNTGTFAKGVEGRGEKNSVIEAWFPLEACFSADAFGAVLSVAASTCWPCGSAEVVAGTAVS